MDVESFTWCDPMTIVGADGIERSWGEHWVRIAAQLGDAGLDWHAHRHRLVESIWRLGGDVECFAWPGPQTVLAQLATSGPDPNNPDAPSAVETFCCRLELAVPAFCDARARTREGAFDDLVLRPAQRQLLQLSQTILARRDSSTFLPLLIATRVRYPSDGLAYLEMVNAVGEVLAVPRLLSERDHRIVRWLAVQVLRFWLTVYEAARHLRDLSRRIPPRTSAGGGR